MLNALIVDDERLARAEMRRLLQPHLEQINIVGEASSGEEALALINELPVDLVFLDIHMPGLTGLELAGKLPARIQFVFCTAYDSFALDAFSLNAVDYLVKPIHAERLAASLMRLQPSTSTPTADHYLPDNHGVLLKFGDINRIVRLQEIERFESIGNHAAVYTPYGKAYIHSSLSRIETRLDPQQFFKANRGDIIRVDCITQLEPSMAVGGLVAVLRSGQHVEVSRRQAQSLRQLFNAW